MIAYECLKYLHKLNIGKENVDLFLGFEPESPKNCITLYDESAPTLDESSCLNVDNFGLHIICRNENYLISTNKINEIHSLIAGFSGNFIEGGKFVSYVNVSVSPYFLGKDLKGLNQWTSHYNIRVAGEVKNNRL